MTPLSDYETGIECIKRAVNAMDRCGAPRDLLETPDANVSDLIEWLSLLPSNLRFHETQLCDHCDYHVPDPATMPPNVTVLVKADGSGCSARRHTDCPRVQVMGFADVIEPKFIVPAAFARQAS